MIEDRSNFCKHALGEALGEIEPIRKQRAMQGVGGVLGRRASGGGMTHTDRIDPIGGVNPWSKRLQGATDRDGQTAQFGCAKPKHAGGQRIPLVAVRILIDRKQYKEARLESMSGRGIPRDV